MPYLGNFPRCRVLQDDFDADARAAKDRLAAENRQVGNNAGLIPAPWAGQLISPAAHLGQSPT
jgi:hypothetical protein